MQISGWVSVNYVILIVHFVKSKKCSCTKFNRWQLLTSKETSDRGFLKAFCATAILVLSYWITNYPHTQFARFGIVWLRVVSTLEHFFPNQVPLMVRDLLLLSRILAVNPVAKSLQIRVCSFKCFVTPGLLLFKLQIFMTYRIPFLLNQNAPDCFRNLIEADFLRITLCSKSI